MINWYVPFLQHQTPRVYRSHANHVNLHQLLQSHMDIETQVKHLGQKYMGIRPVTHGEEMFKMKVDVDKDGHAVPINVSEWLAWLFLVVY